MAEADPLIAGDADAERGPVYGKYRGVVLNNVDTKGLGRITAIVPELLGAIPTGWASPCIPVAGMKAGFFDLPAIGSGVWIEFEGGDISRPIWVGGYWGMAEAPNEPPSAAPPQPTQKIWRSDLGLTVAMNDLLQTVSISDPLGLNKIMLDVKSGTITISGVARVVLDAPMVQEGSANAIHPSVIGDELYAYLAQLVATFNAHVHPGELALGFMPVTPAPPIAPMLPPKPSLLSKKVFLE